MAVHDAPSRPGLPPELDPRRRRPAPAPARRAGRLAQLLVGTLSALILIVSVGGYVVVRWFDGTISRLHLDLSTGTAAASGTSNWLLVGTDSRAGTGNEYGGKAVAGERSDTTILAHVDKNGTTTMVSIPRDTLVSIPAYQDSAGQKHPAQKNKFNHAIEVGGPPLLVATVKQLTGINVDHYVSVDLAGFKRVTDAVGGVNVCVLKSTAPPDSNPNDAGTATIISTNTNDPFSGWHGGPGNLHLNGDQALAFVRQRHGLPDGDLNRIQRQQQFLGSIFRSATGSGTLFNPARVASLLFSVRDALSLDNGTTSSDLEALAERLKGTAASNVVFTTLPVRGLLPTDPGVFSANNLLQLANVGSVEVYDPKALDAFLAPLRGEQPSPAPSSAAPTAPIVAVAPSAIRVQVHNGTMRSGLARNVSTGMAQLHFTSSIGADAPALATSEVQYAPADQKSADTVMAAVPGSVARADASLVPGTVVLVLGDNYAGLQTVRVGSGATTATPTRPAAGVPTPAPTPTPPPVTAESASNRCTL